MNLSLVVSSPAEIQTGIEKAIRHMAAVELSRTNITNKARERTAIVNRASALNDAADLVASIKIELKQ